MPHQTLSRGSTLVLATATLLLAACTGDATTPTPSTTPPPEATPTSDATPTTEAPDPTAIPTPAVPPATETPEPPPDRAPLPVAPEGRTDIPHLDALIEQLISASPQALEDAFERVPAVIPTCVRFGSKHPLRPIPTSEWTALLGSSDRSLYAITRATYQDAPALHILIDLTNPELTEVDASPAPVGPDERWRFTLAAAELVEIQRPCERPGRWHFTDEIDDYVIAPSIIESETAPPGAPPELRADGWPVDAIGPLVVFSVQVRERRDPAAPWHSWPVTAIVTYDAGADRELGRFELDGREARYTMLGLAGAEVLIDAGRIPSAPPAPDYGVYAYSLAGEQRRLVTNHFRGSPYGPVLAQPGDMLAGHTGGLERCGDEGQGCLVLVNAATGAIESPPIGSTGLVPGEWRTDGTSLVARSLPDGHGPVPVARITADGDLTWLDVPSQHVIAPGGRWIAGAAEQFELWPDGPRADGIGGEQYRELVIYEVDTDTPRMRIAVPGWSLRSYFDLDWSPDGSQLLVPFLRTPTGPAEGSFKDAYWAWQQEPTRWFLATPHTGHLQEIADPNAIRAGWIDGPLITGTCRGVTTVALPAAARWWDLPRCEDDHGNLWPTTLHVDGTKVATLPTTRALRIDIVAVPPPTS